MNALLSALGAMHFTQYGKQKAVPTNLTSSHCRDENHPGFSKVESSLPSTQIFNILLSTRGS